MKHTKRLDTNVKLNSEAQQLEAKARQYTKERRGYLQKLADDAQIGLPPLEMDRIYDICNGISQGVLETFKETARREITSFVEHNPDRVRHSVLADWMNSDMNDQEKAKREIASWVDNPKLVFFDTETTGWYDEGHVPVTAAACNVNDTVLCSIQMRALDNKGTIIPITEGASAVNGITDEMIAGYQPLEENEWGIRELETLMETGAILTGYNTKFDRDMLTRAIAWAMMRIAQDPAEKSIYGRLNTLHAHFANPVHWLETKDIFCRAVGEEPYSGPGKYLKLEDIARRTNALVPDEKQARGALADCKLLAKIVRNIRKEIDDMAPKTKNAPVEKETGESQEWSQDAIEHIQTLEKALHEAEERANRAEADLFHAIANCTALSEQLAQYQNSDTIDHREARDLTWCDLEINGFRFNWTIREGETVEAAVESAFKTVRALQAIRDTEKVKTFRVGLRDNWKPLKGFEDTGNGNGKAPTENQPPSDAVDTDHRAARGLPPAANKPNVPPKQSNAPAPQSGQSSNPPQGKTTGEKKSQQCNRIVRHQIDGQNTYDLPFTLNNGKPAERPFAPSKKDTGALEKALVAAGYDLNTLDIGTEYDLPILVEWTVGNQIPNSNPPKYYRDNMTFTIQATFSEEEMPF